MVWKLEQLSYVEWMRFFKAVNFQDVNTVLEILPKAQEAGVTHDFENASIGEILDWAREAFEPYGDEFVKAIDTEGYTVDLKKWKAVDFARYQAARNRWDADEVEKLVTSVVKFNGKAVSSPMSFDTGLRVIKAVGEAYSRALSGKN